MARGITCAIVYWCPKNLQVRLWYELHEKHKHLTINSVRSELEFLNVFTSAYIIIPILPQLGLALCRRPGRLSGTRFDNGREEFRSDNLGIHTKAESARIICTKVHYQTFHSSTMNESHQIIKTISRKIRSMQKERNRCNISINYAHMSSFCHDVCKKEDR